MPAAQSGRVVSRALAVHVIVPLVLFYGLRWLDVQQFVALLAGAAIPVVAAVREIAVDRRVSGVRVFVLGTMLATVLISFVTGSPRVLLIRNAWGTAALGLFLLGSVLIRKPFLYEAGSFVFDDEKRRTWTGNWERFPEFRGLLLRCSVIWGVACLADASLRVVAAMVLPVDVVPVLDDVLLVVTLAVLLLVQRVYGRAYLRGKGLCLNGVEIRPLGAAR
ncbi:hypothetical protein GCM10022222_05320 [Amycolatopsis ultiminotia]|uniref:Intracellular septation protein A n=1 Tax=Amycolatopsis ultiminotia TaxID=543629 RepID=A0ABP6V260_9PSEU